MIVENAVPLRAQAFVDLVGLELDASVKVRFRRGSGPEHVQSIALVSLPRVPFGGRRWYFICPETGARAAVLYLPPGECRFLSRAAYGLRYRVEHQTSEDTDIDNFFRLFRRITGYDPPSGTFTVLPPRPKGMHQRTYLTLSQELEAISRNIFTRIGNRLTGWKHTKGEFT